MCVRILRTARHIAEPWNPQARTITIPAILSATLALTAVRAVLAELCVPQPAAGAVCWCGDPVPLTEPLVPSQRNTSSEVMTRGA